ncbi:MAG: KDO2-lipid IV(A) lauroyltransferase [Limisphaerales bacterium]|jgi:KDO2-lipid IV(A) lauroyltransferase
MPEDSTQETQPAKRKGRRRGKHVAKAHIASPLMWPTWLAVAVAWIIARLPLSWVFALGRGLGGLLYRLAKSRRHVTHVNLAACFPELSEAEVAEMAKQTFKNVSIGALELMIPWLNPRRSLAHRIEVKGIQHLRDAVDQGRGVVLIGAHFTVMDVISEVLSQCGPIDLMYRWNKNPVWEWLQLNGRQRYFDNVIEREDTRSVLKCLRGGRVIWYAPDQDYGPRHSVFAPFFGVETATIVATSRLAKLNQSPVLLLRQSRNAQTKTWLLEFSPIIENFPTDDDLADAVTMNGLIEDMIRIDPTQYLWLHKRFKTRPPNTPSLYL